MALKHRMPLQMFVAIVRSASGLTQVTYLDNGRQFVSVSYSQIEIVSRIFMLVHFILQLMSEVFGFKHYSTLQNVYCLILLIYFCRQFRYLGLEFFSFGEISGIKIR